MARGDHLLNTRTLNVLDDSIPFVHYTFTNTYFNQRQPWSSFRNLKIRLAPIQFAVVRHELDNHFLLNDHFDTNPDYIPDSERSIKSDSYRPVFQYTYHFILTTQHTYLHRQRSVSMSAPGATVWQSLTWTRV